MKPHEEQVKRTLSPPPAAAVGAQEDDHGWGRFELDHIAFGLEAGRIAITHPPGEGAGVGQFG